MSTGSHLTWYILCVLETPLWKLLAVIPLLVGLAGETAISAVVQSPQSLKYSQLQWNEILSNLEFV